MKSDELRIVRAVSGVVLLCAAALAADVKVAGGAGTVSVSVVRRVDVGYEIVTTSKPLEFSAAGPGWLRVYTRLWWPAGKTGAQSYKLSLWQEDAVRPVQFAAGLSPTSLGPRGHKVGQWRSFFIQVPKGAGHYRLALDQAPGDSVAVRVAVQAPEPAQEVAVPGARTLTLAEGSDTSRYCEIGKGRQLRFAVDGPCRLVVRVRLNFDPSMSGIQPFKVSIARGDSELVGRAMRVSRSSTAAYENDAAVVPSSERTLRVSLPSGHHALTVTLSGTLAESGAIRVESIAGDKYE
jgi:hypothetical protein